MVSIQTILRASVVATIAILSLSGQVFAKSKVIYVYATDPASGILYTIDAKTQKVVHKAALKGQPVSLWSVNKGKLLVSDAGEKAPVIYDTVKKSISDIKDIDMTSLKSALILKEDAIIFCASKPLAVVKVARSTKKIISTLRLPDNSRPEAIALAPNGNLYVTDISRMKIYVVNPRSMKLVTEMDSHGRYINLAIAKNGKAYFTGTDENWDSGAWLDVWDTNNNAFVERLTGLLPVGASFTEQVEGTSSQSELITILERDILISLAFSPPKKVDPSIQFPLLVAIDLASKQIKWEVKQAEPTEEPITVIHSNGDIYLSTKEKIMVINPTTGKIKSTIPLSNIWGMTTDGGH